MSFYLPFWIILLVLIYASFEDEILDAPAGMYQAITQWLRSHRCAWLVPISAVLYWGVLGLIGLAVLIVFILA